VNERMRNDLRFDRSHADNICRESKVGNLVVAVVHVLMLAQALTPFLTPNRLPVLFRENQRENILISFFFHIYLPFHGVSPCKAWLVPPLLPVVSPTSSGESFIGDAAKAGKYWRLH
jgi:hypothetical protein